MSKIPTFSKTMKAFIADYIRQIQALLGRISTEEVEAIVGTLHEARFARRTVLLLGNGGSAATAGHWAEDLCKGADYPGAPRFRALALTDSVAGLTAWANDTGYENVFAGQLANWLEPQDVVIAISGSGNSPNVLNAVRYAREQGALTIGLTGQGGRLEELVDLPLVVPSRCMEQIEDVHLILTHAISTALRQRAAEKIRSSLRVDTPLRRGRAVFLDRDGVINENRADHVKSWNEFKFLEGSLDGLARLATTDFKIVIASNQSAVGRKLITRETLEEIHWRMTEQIEEAGGRVDHVAYCPHTPEEECDCRKPRPGLLIQASRKLELDPSRSYMIGDSWRDIEAGEAAGCTIVLVRTGMGQDTLTRLDELNGHRPAVVDNLTAAIDWIIERERSRQEDRALMVPDVETSG